MDLVPRPAGVRPPPLPFCHICGRQFGTTSLLIHQKTCAKKYEREHGKPAPEPPRTAPIGADMNSREWKAFNRDANSQFEDTVMQPCPHCQRTFLPDRLEIHLRTCGKGHFANPKPRKKSCGGDEDDASESGSATNRAGSVALHLGAAARGEQLEARTPRRSASPPPSARLVPCPYCSRTFMPAALEIHMKSCKPSSPAKPGRAATPDSSHGGARSARGAPLTARSAGDDFLAWARNESRQQLEMARDPTNSPAASAASASAARPSAACRGGAAASHGQDSAARGGEPEGNESTAGSGSNTARGSSSGAGDTSSRAGSTSTRSRSPRHELRAPTGTSKAFSPRGIGSPRATPKAAPTPREGSPGVTSTPRSGERKGASIKEQQAWQPPASETCRSPCTARPSSPTLFR